MKSDDALKKIDNLVNILTVEIPEVLEIDGKLYPLKEDIISGERIKMIKKYEKIYENLRDRIRKMEEVPQEMVDKALILRRAILFLKEYRGHEEIEDAERWLEYIKKIKM
ncbi:MAG TPA: hypothetical protein ENL31_01810 [Candidatus Aciduliprofundum boonei]|uniref:Uncharacterized protein n=1 Tax=Candidatus Aciduliprofundum boonei TaxID=379547 RepID=A0A7J3TBB2_9ARCH|nr:hypothetical protein [Candidatus Aciduliprofundum boonei]